MEKAVFLPNIKSNSGTLLFNLSILAAIYLLPAISHLLTFPLYYFDPMRIALIFALLHTTKRNTFIIAFTLPIFSFIISSHPSLIKSGLLATELLLNVLLYFILVHKTNSRMFSLVISIIISKVFYYILKYITIETGVLAERLFSTPFYYQVITIFIILLYVFGFEYFIKKNE